VLFVSGSLQFVEWALEKLGEPANPIFLATGAACAFYFLMKEGEHGA
jgi:hypothetical protein